MNEKLKAQFLRNIEAIEFHCKILKAESREEMIKILIEDDPYLPQKAELQGVSIEDLVVSTERERKYALQQLEDRIKQLKNLEKDFSQWEMLNRKFQ
jgi:hypothetical protein